MLATTTDNQNNDKYIGALIAVSCEMPNPIPLARLRLAILDSSVLPNEWAPEVRQPIALFHDVIKRFTHISGKDVFKFDPDVCGFSVDEHHNYISMRLVKNKLLATPVIYKVFHTTKHKTAPDAVSAIAVPAEGANPDVDQQMENFAEAISKLPQDAQVHEGIVISLVRISGTPEDDATGGSCFEIQCHGDESLRPRYEPFLDAVRASYDELMMQQYGNAQVRDLIKSTMRDKLRATPFLGWHFAVGPKWEIVQELGARLGETSPGIRILSIPIHKNAEDTPPEQREIYEQVVMSVNEDLLEQAKLLEREVADALDSPKTRRSTLVDRAAKLEALRNQLVDYRNHAMLIDSVIEDIIADSMTMVEQGLAV